ncbi:unnamed protein product [Orchesella dallaii]|uniref:DUF243 domain-containing protein n=1 Tax=Orchesella dallaii TaxID=48710 RepID=A0ABP1RI47_9HEXA
MRVLMIVAASLLGVAYAGVGRLTASEEANIISIFKRACNGAGPEEQNIGGMRVYCKKGPGETNHRETHEVTVKPEPGSAQAVFVEPPPANYQHDVIIRTQPGEGDETKVYVLPQQATHTINPKVIRPPGTHSKPTVYFLNGGNGGGRSGSSSSSGFNPNSIQGEYIPSSSQPIQNSYGTPEVIQSVRGYN